MDSIILRRALVMGLASWSAFAAAAGDPKHGAQVFRACASCHSVEQGRHMTGPSLAAVRGRKAGTAQGFQRYSEALKRSGLEWTDENLDKWLANPERLVPGNTMTFPGLAQKKDRDDVIAYLASPGEAAPGDRGGGAMMMRGNKPDLKKAPPAGQVISITHCGDTYTVKTGDGATNKVWEFNLRFKTDSSALGPAPGKPVIVGAGMRGDRASVVFAGPAEISAFIGNSCPQ